MPTQIVPNFVTVAPWPWRIASDAAKFGQPESKLGLLPGFGGSQRLSRLVGKGRAMQLLMTGEMIDRTAIAGTAVITNHNPQGSQNSLLPSS